MKNAPTPYVLVLDADFATSAHCHDSLLPYRKLTRTRALIVLPAFETPQREVAENKTTLLKTYKNGRNGYTIFRPSGNNQKVSDYNRWRNMSTTKTYTVQHKNGYDPYVMCHNFELPSFYEEYEGYGENKYQWFHVLKKAGYHLLVHPSEYVVHWWHELRHNTTSRGIQLKNNQRKTKAFHDLVNGRFGG